MGKLYKQFIILLFTLFLRFSQFFCNRTLYHSKHPVDSILIALLFSNFFPSVDLSMIIQIFRPITLRYQHSANHRVNVAVHVHQLHTQQQRSSATHDLSQ